MTATTKEILGLFSSLYEGVTTAIPRPRDYREADRDRLFHLVLTELPSLLSDSERLAAIEAVTGEEVNSVIETIRRRGLLMEAIPVIFSLSARVAEQEEEIKRLRALSEGWHKDYSTQFRRAEAFETAYEDHLTGCAIERDTLERIGLVDESGEDNAGLWRNVRAEAAEAERDAIRAHMEGGNAS